LASALEVHVNVGGSSQFSSGMKGKWESDANQA